MTGQQLLERLTQMSPDELALTVAWETRYDGHSTHQEVGIPVCRNGRLTLSIPTYTPAVAQPWLRQPA